MKAEEILQLMQELNLTLRCFPTHEVYLTAYREGQPLKEGDTIIEVQMKDYVTGEQVMVKRIRREEFHRPKWGVKIGAHPWPEWQKSDFYGSTAEEAIQKAVEQARNGKTKTEQSK